MTEWIPKAGMWVEHKSGKVGKLLYAVPGTSKQAWAVLIGTWIDFFPVFELTPTVEPEDESTSSSQG